MHYSNKGERVSLFEGAPSLVDNNCRFSASYFQASEDSSSSGGGLADDESLLVLDRLRDVAQKAVRLEVTRSSCWG
jgi:hypothetical protein